MLQARPTVMAVVPRVLERIHERVTSTVRESPPLKRKLFAWALGVGRRSLPFQLAGRRPPFWLRLQRGIASALVYSKVRERMGGRVRIMISGAAPLRRELAEFFFSVGLPVFEGYGLTETSPVIAVNYPGRVKLGTVGPVIPRIEVKLGEQVEDEDGGSGREILVRGPNVTPGYYRDEQGNREAFFDGWFHTGDLGTLDADGFLSITGRKKNLFKTSGGKYVAPERLEGLLQGHPHVQQIVVVGYGRKFVGALIVPNFAALEAHARRRGLSFSSREELIAKPEIREFMQQQVDEAMRWLPPHERIRQIALLPREFSVETGDLTPTQKIKRRVVEEKYRDVIDEIYARPAPSSK
jgi:long-chain acyl-CoA synthetase